jgi:exonuclease SbcC
MPRTDASFDAIRQAIQSLWPPDDSRRMGLDDVADMLLLRLPNDIAAFALFNGSPSKEFSEAYESFKRLYRENNRLWDQRTLSFVLCRASEHPEDDRFYASLEIDPLFCRKYVIRAVDSPDAQRVELLRLPFFPLGTDGQGGLERPQSAQDLLQASGLSASLARNLVEGGHRAADRIAEDLRDGLESLPTAVVRSGARKLAVTQPRASTRVTELTVEGFRAYKEAQTFDLDASVVVLYGPNGLGKTSLFDAIDYGATGRIGRLCRNRRSATDFARIATHLDKTPGSGSVTLGVRSTDPKAPMFKVQRSTGDWSTAWIDGVETDRKGVLNRLTQAEWLEAAPRQQTIEALFRATHLFGQDEQELLTEFQKGSIIPEAFVSEMLALQDYSQALSKVADVLAGLEKHRSAAEEDIAKLQVERDTVAASLPEVADDGVVEPSALQSTIDALRQALANAGSGIPPAPGKADATSYSEWHEVTSAQAGASAERAQSAGKLRNEFEVHEGRLREEAARQQQLAEIDRQLASMKHERDALEQRIHATAAALTKAVEERASLEQRRQDIRSASESLTERNDLTRQVTSIQAEIDRQVLERGEGDSRVALLEAALSKQLGASSEAQRLLGAARADRTRMDQLFKELPQHNRDVASVAEIAAKLSATREALGVAEDRLAAASRDAVAAKAAREVSAPEYERAVSAQTELETLLDRIQTHIHDEACPLCGSHFESVEDLLVHIRRRRDTASPFLETTTRYNALVVAETHASDLVRVVTAEVTAARSSLQELTSLLKNAEERVANFTKRLTQAQFGETEIKTPGEALRSRGKQLAERLTALERAAQAARDELKETQDAQTAEVAKRTVVAERIADLERSRGELKDRTVALDARIGRVSGGNEAFVSAAQLQAVEKAIETNASSIEKLNATNREESGKAKGLAERRQELDKRRAKLVADIAKLSRQVAEFRQRLRSLQLSDDAPAEELEAASVRETDRGTVLRDIAAKGAVVLRALRDRDARLDLSEKRKVLTRLSQSIQAAETRRQNIDAGASTCSAIERLLKSERQTAIQRHIDAYGPMITMIQQRLRSVYGFGGVHLEAQGGEAKVRVEWRRKSVHVAPTDFFSDSQKQILMLSIFLAGGLRQNWSGFAPVLLDDPVTHFDDLNAYGFVELIRGIISTSPNEWQFIISTCEQRLFDLMLKKFSKLESGSIFYEFMGLTDKGPIVERR